MLATRRFKSAGIRIKYYAILFSRALDRTDVWRSIGGWSLKGCQ